MGIKGIDTAIKHMDARAKAFQNRTPEIYSGLSIDMAQAIDTNADTSYTGSPAKATALRSVRNWIHSGKEHLLKIMSLCYANYRQYGCGGIPIVKLVIVKKEDIERMRERFSKGFHQ